VTGQGRPVPVTSMFGCDTKLSLLLSCTLVE
jgi:hypothetical protein